MGSHQTAISLERSTWLRGRHSLYKPIKTHTLSPPIQDFATENLLINRYIKPPPRHEPPTTSLVHNHHAIQSSILDKLIQNFQTMHSYFSSLFIWKRCNLWLTRPILLHSMEWMWICPYNNPRPTPKKYRMGKTCHTHHSQLHHNYNHHTQWLDKQYDQTASTITWNSYNYHPTHHFTRYRINTLTCIVQQQKILTYLHSNTIPYTHHNTTTVAP
jgi:hypothetical protein